MPERARAEVTDSEIDAAIARAREYDKYARKVVRAVYSKPADSLRMVLSDGATYTIPRNLIQGLRDAAERDLNRIQIVGEGTGLLWPLLDVAHYVPALLQGVYGSEKWMTFLHKERRELTLVDARRGSRRRIA